MDRPQISFSIPSNLYNGLERIMNNENGKTIRFSIGNESERQMKQILATVYEALIEKGYNPIDQIVGYILSEDPTYITNHKNARSLICKLDRDEVMSALLRNYLGL